MSELPDDPPCEVLPWDSAFFGMRVARVRGEVLDARRSKSRPEMGLVKIQGTMRRGEETVLRLVFTGLFGVRAP